MRVLGWLRRVVGAVRTAHMAGFGKIIGFDMGGLPPMCRILRARI